MAFACTGLSMAFDGPDGPIEALAPLDLEVADREFVCIVGPSGCGKSTLLRLLAGILEPTSGSVRFSEPERGGRPPTAMVFQDHGLFPWMDVLDNVAFGLESAGVPRAERRAAAASIVERFGLHEFVRAYPHQLSGGMRQRVGIARALLTDPQVLLMDEPFGALDAQTKVVLQEDLLATWEQDRREVVYVTHDLTEAVRLADRVIVLSGRPAAIVADLPIDAARPRGHGYDLDPRLEPVRRDIWSLLEEEVRRRASD
jgi:NitT/TauT family transport system ATP-binding protein